MDETINSLIRFVARGFYSKPYILVLDAVLLHSVLSEDDLTYLLGMKAKELRMYCNKLADDRLLSTHMQKEENPKQRAISKTYYYIHITEAIDSIKWKVHSITNMLKQEMSQYGNPNGYICKRCGKKFSQLDAISLLNSDKSQFICDNCGFTLVEDNSNEQASVKQKSLEKLMIQIDPIIAFLKKIDDTVIEDNNFDSALLKSIPAQASSSGIYNLPNKYKSSKLTSNSTQNIRSQAATLHVSITATDETEDKERQLKEEKRQKLQQNALPSWHSASTVDQEPSSDSQTPEPVETKPEVDTKPDIKQETPAEDVKEIETNAAELKDKEAQDALAAYYADLAQREADDDEDEDDEDDEDDFEDI